MTILNDKNSVQYRITVDGKVFKTVNSRSALDDILEELDHGSSIVVEIIEPSTKKQILLD